jgi:hypothetical protein
MGFTLGQVCLAERTTDTAQLRHIRDEVRIVLENPKEV